MFVDSQRGHFKATSGWVIFGSLALSVIEPDLVEPTGPPPPPGAAPGGGKTVGESSEEFSLVIPRCCCCWWWFPCYKFCKERRKIKYYYMVYTI